MPKLFITPQNERQFENQVRSKINNIVTDAMKQSEKILVQQSAILANKIAESAEFNDLKGKLVGAFGFTPEEVADLDRILTLLLPFHNNITDIDIKFNGPEKFIILDWVNFDKLKDHPFAQHELTRLDTLTNTFDTIQIVSWVDWLENGVTVRGFELVEPVDRRQEKFSRSKKAIMRPVDGGLWEYAPTDVFHRTANNFNGVNDIKNGFALIVRRLGKK